VTQILTIIRPLDQECVFVLKLRGYSESHWCSSQCSSQSHQAGNRGEESYRPSLLVRDCLRISLYHLEFLKTKMCSDYTTTTGVLLLKIFFNLGLEVSYRLMYSA